MRRIQLSFFLILLAGILSGQEVHLSQFYNNQQYLNPALMGKYEGMYRVSANYRNQWRQIGNAPLVTSMIAFDHKFYFRSDEIAGGIIVMNDQVSTFGFNTSKIILSGSYQKRWAGHEFRGGAQFGLVMKSFDLNGQSFPNQWVYEQGEFDRNIDPLETNLQESQNFMDVNVGLAWSKEFARVKTELGFSIMHVNRPVDSYANDDDARLGLTSVYHGKALYRLDGNYSIEPKILYQRAARAQNMVLGSNLYRELENETISHVQVGLLYRSGFGRNRDAIIPVAGLRYKRFDVGLSYDFNVGELSQLSTNKGTYEFSLVYTARAFTPKKMTLPCDRY